MSSWGPPKPRGGGECMCVCADEWVSKIYFNMTSNLLMALKHLCNYINTDSSSSILMCLSVIKLSGLDSDIKNELTSINHLIPVVSNFPWSPTIFPWDETKQKQFPMRQNARCVLMLSANGPWNGSEAERCPICIDLAAACGADRSGDVIKDIGRCDDSTHFEPPRSSFKTPTVASVSSKHPSVHVECSKTMREHNKAQLKIN